MPTSRTEYVFGLNTRSENRSCFGHSDVVPPTNVRYEYGPLLAYIQNRDLQYGFEIDNDAGVYTAWRANTYGSQVATVDAGYSKRHSRTGADLDLVPTIPLSKDT